MTENEIYISNEKIFGLIDILKNDVHIEMVFLLEIEIVLTLFTYENGKIEKEYG